MGRPGTRGENPGSAAAEVQASRDRASPAWRVLLAIVRRLPQATLSRATGWLADRRLPTVLRRPVVRMVARGAGMDLGEAERPPAGYASVSELFCRRLRPGSRRWPEDSLAVGSPVDGVVGALGRIAGGRAIQAKGIDYGIGDLLGSREEAARFEDGRFLTIYLAPRHYHRIHAPLTAGVRAARAIPGALLPVNDAAVASIPALFPRNERLVAHLALNRRGEMAMVAVGAFNVGRISAEFDPGFNGPHGGVTNRGGRGAVRERRYDPALPVERGEELMVFRLGSTVVLLFEGPSSTVDDFHPAVVPGAEIRLGAPLFALGSDGA